MSKACVSVYKVPWILCYDLHQSSIQQDRNGTLNIKLINVCTSSRDDFGGQTGTR